MITAKTKLIYSRLWFAFFVIIASSGALANSGNLISNPNVTVPNLIYANQPQGWLKGSYGNNTNSFTYLNSLGNGTSGLQIQMSGYKDGAAYWYFSPVPIGVGYQYVYSEYYQSNVATLIQAKFDDGNGNYTYRTLATPPASTGTTISATFTAPAGVALVTIIHYMKDNGSLITNNFSLQSKNNPVAPTINLTAPVTGSSQTGVVQLVANPTADAAVGIRSVQFQVDGANVGLPVSASPYQVKWNSAAVLDGVHNFTAVVTSNDGITSTSPGVQFSVSNGPAVSVTSPPPSTVSGTTAVAAQATAGSGVSSVQFFVDGLSFGSPVSVSPYQTTLDTTTLPNGSHKLSAVVTGNDGTTASSSLVPLNVNNLGASNLLTNPLLQIISSANPLWPQGWSPGFWGTNTANYSWSDTGHGGGKSAVTQVTSYTSGAAYWSPGRIPVTGGQTYYYSDYFQSDVPTEVDFDAVMSNGTVQNVWVGSAAANPGTWGQFQSSFAVPTGAVSINIVHEIYNPGTLIASDFVLAPNPIQGFNRPIVTLTFDDSILSQYTYALPLLQQYGFLATFYIITRSLSTLVGYMTNAQVQQLNSLGHEIGSHTVDHVDLATLSLPGIDYELQQSQQTLQRLINAPVTNFASPYGSANNLALVDAALYYRTVRGVQSGFNARNMFNPYNILIQEVYANTPVSQVKAWIQQAIATNTWLVLLYHATDPNLTPATDPYSTLPANLQAELAYLKSTGVSVQTLNQALNEIIPQL